MKRTTIVLILASAAAGAVAAVGAIELFGDDPITRFSMLPIVADGVHLELEKRAEGGILVVIHNDTDSEAWVDWQCTRGMAWLWEGKPGFVHSVSAGGFRVPANGVLIEPFAEENRPLQPDDVHCFLTAAFSSAQSSTESARHSVRKRRAYEMGIQGT